MLLFTLVAAEVHGSTSAGGARTAEACRKPRYVIGEKEVRACVDASRRSQNER